MQKYISMLLWLALFLWSAFSGQFVVLPFLALGAAFELVLLRRAPLPKRWELPFLLMQIGWTAAAILAGSPFLGIGLAWQAWLIRLLARSYKEEQKRCSSLEENMRQQEDLLDELRRQRHDYQKHLSALRHAGSGAEEYYEVLEERQAGVDTLLRDESNLIAGLLYAYSERAREAGVDLDYSIQQRLSGIPVNPYELVSLLGNILDNAVEAAAAYQKSSGKTGKILFVCRKQSGFWLLHCQNDTVPLKNDTIEKMFTKKAISTKGGAHEGIGTRQIMQIVKKHHGLLDFTAAGTDFKIKIKLPDVIGGNA